MGTHLRPQGSQAWTVRTAAKPMRRKQTETRAGYLRKSPRGMKRRPHTPARKGRQPRGFSVPTVPRCCSSKVMPETTIWALWLSGLSGCLIASSRGGPSDLYSLCRYGSGRFPPLPRAPPPCLTLVIGVPDSRLPRSNVPLWFHHHPVPEAAEISEETSLQLSGSESVFFRCGLSSGTSPFLQEFPVARSQCPT